LLPTDPTPPAQAWTELQQMTINRTDEDGNIFQNSGKAYRITTDGYTGSRTTARVKTYADVLDDYENHPESKCADARGNVCGKQTIGLLYRRHIEIDRVVYIGKESNRLEDVESGMIQDEDEVYTEYPDPRRDECTRRYSRC